MFQFHSLFYCCHCLSGFQCKTKLGINLSGSDKIMGVRIDTRLNPEHYTRLFPHFTGDSV